MVKQYSEQKIFFIADRHSVHKSGKVTNWLVSGKEKIDLFFLPAVRS